MRTTVDAFDHDDIDVRQHRFNALIHFDSIVFGQGFDELIDAGSARFDIGAESGNAGDDLDAVSRFGVVEDFGKGGRVRSVEADHADADFDPVFSDEGGNKNSKQREGRDDFAHEMSVPFLHCRHKSAMQPEPAGDSAGSGVRNASPQTLRRPDTSREGGGG